MQEHASRGIHDQSREPRVTIYRMVSCARPSDRNRRTLDRWDWIGPQPIAQPDTNEYPIRDFGDIAVKLCCSLNHSPRSL